MRQKFGSRESKREGKQEVTNEKDIAVDCFSNVSVGDLTSEQQASYWHALKQTGNEDQIASLNLAIPGSEKMLANFDERFQNGTLTITKTQIAEEIFEENENNTLLRLSPNNQYGMFTTGDEYFLYDFENKKKIDIWADTEHSVSGTQDAVERLINKYGNKLLAYCSTWSQNGTYLIVETAGVIHSDLDRSGATSSKLNDIYLIDAQTGGCYAIKDYEEWTKENGRYPSRFCTDAAGTTIYYCEWNEQDSTYCIMKLNKQTGIEEKIVEVSGSEFYLPEVLVHTETGKIAGLCQNKFTENLMLLTWKQENGAWTRSEKEVCPYSILTEDTWYGRTNISDSGRGIYVVNGNQKTIAFDVEGDEESYVILGEETENGRSYKKCTLEEAKENAKSEEENGLSLSYLSPDGRYLLWYYVVVNSTSGQGEKRMDVIDLETLQSQTISLEEFSPIRGFQWLNYGLINLGNGIYTLNE